MVNEVMYSRIRDYVPNTKQKVDIIEYMSVVVYALRSTAGQFQRIKYKLEEPLPQRQLKRGPMPK
jgi:hypothetical protein